MLMRSVPRTTVLSSVAVLFALAAPCVQSAGPTEHWIADPKGCKVSNPDPGRAETVTWSGSCAGGYAEGDGLLSWSRHGKSAGTYQGEMHAGRLDGKGRADYPNGDRYEGDFYADNFDGHGVFIFANGNRYEGEFVAGASTRSGTLTLADGRQFTTDLVLGVSSSTGVLVPATLIEACYGDGGELKSVDLVRSMGYPLQDEQAIGIVKVRSTDARILRVGGEVCVGLGKEPVRGCHMIGVLFTQGTYTTVSQGVQCTSSQG
jgi:hypothetical protein